MGKVTYLFSEYESQIGRGNIRAVLKMVKLGGVEEYRNIGGARFTRTPSGYGEQIISRENISDEIVLRLLEGDSPEEVARHFHCTSPEEANYHGGGVKFVHEAQDRA